LRGNPERSNQAIITCRMTGAAVPPYVDHHPPRLVTPARLPSILNRYHVVITIQRHSRHGIACDRRSRAPDHAAGSGRHRHAPRMVAQPGEETGPLSDRRGRAVPVGDSQHHSDDRTPSVRHNIPPVTGADRRRNVPWRHGWLPGTGQLPDCAVNGNGNSDSHERRATAAGSVKNLQ